MRENADQNNPKHGHFLRSVTYQHFALCCEIAAKDSVALKKKIEKRVTCESEEVIKTEKRLNRMPVIKKLRINYNQNKKVHFWERQSSCHI